MGLRHPLLCLLVAALRAAAQPHGAPWAWPRQGQRRSGTTPGEDAPKVGVPRRHGTRQELQREAEAVGTAAEDEDRLKAAESLRKWQTEARASNNASRAREVAHEERDSKKLEADIKGVGQADAEVPPAPSAEQRAYMEPSMRLPKEMPKTEPKAAQTERPTAAPVSASTPGRLIFLFLVGKSLNHLPIWKEFFHGAPAEQFSSFIHFSESSSGIGPGLQAAVPGVQQVHTVPTYYCHDLVTAMVHLVKYAILANPKGHPNDRFIFVSDSTLPLKPFHQVRQTLLGEKGSDLCIFPKDHWGTTELSASGLPEASALRGNSGTGTTGYLVKHHQWVILNREHAEKMSRVWTPVDERGHWEVPLMGRSQRMVSVNAFHRTNEANYCTDEWAFFATLFGAVPVRRGEESIAVPGLENGGSGMDLPLATLGPRADDVQGNCYTFAFFESSGQLFTQFAKKIEDTQKEGTEVSCSPSNDGCWQHPMEIKKVSASALHVLRQSHFLFARKFSDRFEVIGSDYGAVVFRNRSDYV